MKSKVQPAERKQPTFPSLYVGERTGAVYLLTSPGVGTVVMEGKKNEFGRTTPRIGTHSTCWDFAGMKRLENGAQIIMTQED